MHDSICAEASMAAILDFKEMRISDISLSILIQYLACGPVCNRVIGEFLTST